MTSTVVILLSDKRSGSTMFEREIARHPDVSHVQYTPHTYNETHYWVKAACALPDTPVAGFSNGARPRSYGSRTGAKKSLLKTVEGNVVDFVAPQDDRQLVFEGWEALCQTYAHPVFFEKTPHHAHHRAALDLIGEWIKGTSHTVRVIGLIRNPMAVMYSALQLFHTDPDQRQFGWMEANRNILHMGSILDGDQFKLVMYEDLVNDAIGSFQDVCDFIGIPHNDAVGRSVNPHSLDKWRDDPLYDFQLDPDVIGFAKELGYCDADLLNPEKLKPAHHTRIRHWAFHSLKRLQSRVYNQINRLKD